MKELKWSRRLPADSSGMAGAIRELHDAVVELQGIAKTNKISLNALDFKRMIAQKSIESLEESRDIQSHRITETRSICAQLMNSLESKGILSSAEALHIYNDAGAVRTDVKREEVRTPSDRLPESRADLMTFGDVLKALETEPQARFSRHAWLDHGDMVAYIGVQLPDEGSLNDFPYLFYVDHAGRLPFTPGPNSMFADDWFKVTKEDIERVMDTCIEDCVDDSCNPWEGKRWRTAEQRTRCGARRSTIWAV